ncbi:MAG: D-arabinose 5-phosphate isomerase [Nitrospiraceae bacterium]|nr:D-arabinose 5-phosphate isomerase [Nitrospiraceae bacterium]|tara:strand:- start:1563 stop:2522 length:960 start_codon:yes stop_codon:yes gene_type:complete
MSIEDGKRVLTIEAQAIFALVARLDTQFSDAVDILYQCQGKIVVIGMGKSGLIGAKLASTFASTGTPAFFLHAAEGVHGDIGMIDHSDVALIISNSGETAEILQILTAIKRIGVLIVTLAGNPHSTIANESNVVLNVSVNEEACPLGLAPTASTTAALAMGDSLAVALLRKRGFQEQDFAHVHPGGTLGKRLLLRVSNLLHEEKTIPRVQENTSMKAVILEMTSKKLGLTTVDDKEGHLLGVITDGDLRRGLEQNTNILSLNAKAIMSTHPRTIHKDALAAEALHVMEHYAITSLLVTDLQGRTTGVLHLHDILKSGVI